MKNHLIPWLKKDQATEPEIDSDDEKKLQSELSVLKKGNSYTQIGGRRVKFLDISNYLAGGVSYAKFLKAYDVEENKSYFPYEWFDSAEKLDYPALPPYKAFYSTLKQKNVLEDENVSGIYRYNQLQEIWRDQNMKIFCQTK